MYYYKNVKDIQILVRIANILLRETDILVVPRKFYILT